MTCLRIVLLGSALLTLAWGQPLVVRLDAASISGERGPTLLAAGLSGTSGSTVGPDGALYVPEGAYGRVARINPRTGARSTFASGLPVSTIGVGGAVDIAFIGRTAYVLVSLVGPDLNPGNGVSGVYRIDGPTHVTLVADIGAFSVAHPPPMPIDIPTGFQYAIEAQGRSLLVTDGHHNRLLRIWPGGAIAVVRQFDNIVPTGLEVAGDFVLMGQAGPTPHLPADGRAILMRPPLPGEITLLSGVRLLVDVEIGNGGLYALGQGEFPVGAPPGSPALPETGALYRARHDGTVELVIDRVNLPTSLEIIGDHAFVVNLAGEVWKVSLD